MKLNAIYTRQLLGLACVAVLSTGCSEGNVQDDLADIFDDVVDLFGSGKEVEVGPLSGYQAITEPNTNQELLTGLLGPSASACEIKSKLNANTLGTFDSGTKTFVGASGLLINCYGLDVTARANFVVEVGEGITTAAILLAPISGYIDVWTANGWQTYMRNGETYSDITDRGQDVDDLTAVIGGKVYLKVVLNDQPDPLLEISNLDSSLFLDGVAFEFKFYRPLVAD